MSESNALPANPAAEPTLFSALLTPHRSLGSVGFFVVMGLIAGISFVGGVVFFLVGAWPVIGFLGLDVCAGLLGVPGELSAPPRPTRR